MKRNTISVVLATYNEENNLSFCLDSVKDFADEIVIVDGSSADKTVEIAKKYGAKVKITTNKPNFHINKQMAIDLATGDWILQLDADERVSPELAKEIKEKIGNCKLPAHREGEIENSVNGYWMSRKNLFLGKFLMKGGQFPDYTLRLYRRGKGHLPQVHVHEQAEVVGRVEYLKHSLLHYPYKNFASYVVKWNRYNDLLATQIGENLKGKNFLLKMAYAVGYLIVKPAHWFLTTYIRHKGFMDLYPGFVFSLFSALRFPISYIKYVGRYKFYASLILVIAFFLRFYGFSNRWGLGGDDARDAMVALEALKRHEVPLVGSFSSAGPFVFGPLFYWFIMLSYLILPFFVSSPWFFLCLIGVLNVLILIWVGKLLLGSRFSLILGLLACFSPQLVTRSLMLGQHTLVFTFTSLLILFFILFLQKNKKVYAFYMGIFLGIALSMHYQAINLLIFFPAIFLISKLNIKKKITAFLLMLVGFLIPSFPLLLWDAHQNFANIRNILDYFLIAQYRIYVPNSWSLYIFNFIPSYWSFVVGRFYPVAFLTAALGGLIFIYLLLKRKLRQEFVILGLIFFVFIFVNRFYKGERSEGYFLYLAPFILIFSSLVVNFLTENKKKYIKLLGVILLALIISGNMVTIKKSYLQSRAVKLQSATNELVLGYPNQKFSLYDYKFKSYDEAVGLGLILSFRGMESSKGLPLGLGCNMEECRKGTEQVSSSYLQLVTADKLVARGWKRINREDVYDEVIGWSKKDKSLSSNFSLKDYIISMINFNK